MDKKVFKLIVLSLFAVFIASSCAKSDTPFQPNNSVRNRVYASEEEEAKALLLSVEELRQMPKEIRYKRAAALTLKDYFAYKDSAFCLNIDKEEANALGVDEELYNVILKDLNETNHLIKIYNAKGEKIGIDTTDWKRIDY